MQSLAAIAGDQPYRLLFATVSGAHLYGFPSRNSDVDLRGVHLLPLEEVVGLRTGPDTLTHTWTQAGTEIDLVTHDAAKFFRLLLRRNGYVLEQVLSPLRVVTNDDHMELCEIARQCITRNHAHHYRGFASTQWELYAKTGELKPLLYTFRVLLTGIWLMRTGEVEASLPALLKKTNAPAYLEDLIVRKQNDEHERVSDTAHGFETFASDVTALHEELEQAAIRSTLPESPKQVVEGELHDLLLRLRLRLPA
jgi:predicted nucleotidyltransferase